MPFHVTTKLSFLGRDVRVQAMRMHIHYPKSHSGGHMRNIRCEVSV